MAAAAAPPATIGVRAPTTYPTTSSSDAVASPPPEWLIRTWSVTHSTLPMWRSARNVRISYKAVAPKPDGSPRNEDLVEYENADGKGGVKAISGGNTGSAQTAGGVWDWRGKGWLFFVTSHWEILGWGERPAKDGGVERWVVTWFAKTIFSAEGIDIYSDRKEGCSAETVGEVLEALKAMEVKHLAELVEKDMREVKIELPWKER
jgi:hypothetical protein